MRRLLPSLAAALFASAFGATVAANAAGVDELGRFLGTWQSSGNLLDTPYSKAAAAAATTTCGWSNDRVFMICQQIAGINGKDDHSLSVFTYDPAGARYYFYHVGTTAGNDAAIAISGSTVTYTSSFDDHGKHVTIRTLNIWENARFYRWRTEYSTDGVTWSLMGSGTSSLLR